MTVKVTNGGNDMSSQQISDAGLSLSVRGKNPNTGLFTVENLDQDNNGIYTISLPQGTEGTAELFNTSSLEAVLSNSFGILNSKQFPKNQINTK